MARRNRPRGDVAELVRGAGDLVGSAVPDSMLKVARRVRGAASLERTVRGRTVMITGASSGIGRAAAIRVGAAGGTVLLVARSPDKLEQTRRSIEQAGGSAH